MGRSIEIPLNNSEEVLVVDVDDLSSNENENAIIDILTTESVPLRLYLEFAREYYNIGMKLEFERVLKAGANVGASGQYGRDPHYCEVLYTLATYYIDTAKEMNDTSLTLLDGGEKDLNFTVQLATEFVNRADQIDNKVIWIVIAKGNLFLVLKRVEEALKQFRTALELDNSNIVALMGLASSSVAKGDFKTALEYFQRVLCLHPDLKPDVRVAIGTCYFRLHMVAEARKSFERALELDPKNDDALTCLSILDWNEARLSNSEEKLLEVANRLNEAFDVNPLNPLTLLMMGERSLFAKEFEKLELLVNLCLQQTNSKGLRGDAFALKAKALHSQGLYRESLEFYQKAVDGNPDSPVHHFGLGEIYIFLGEFERACECFEKVLLKESDNYESLVKLASIYSLSEETHEKALKYFLKLSELFGTDRNNITDASTGLINEPFCQVEMSSIHEGRDPKIALSGYLHAIDLLKSTSKDVPIEIYNNIGALFFTSGQLDKAEEFFNRGLDESVDGSLMETESSVTLMYNLARHKEEKGDLEDAEKLHRAILAKHPAYTDSRLRLAMSALLRGKPKESRDAIKEAIEINGKAATPLLLLGYSFYEDKSVKTNLKEARTIFEEVLRTVNKHEPYALCSVGNINLTFSRIDPKNKELHTRRAFEFFDKALRLDPKNVYAAAGIGIALVEVGRLSQAREVLSQIHESASNMPTISVNLAHVLIELGQTKSAVTLYEKVLKRHYENRSSHILQCLSRAHYIIAKSSKDPTAMLKSLEYIQRAVKLDPGKMALWYDLALVKQQYAQVLNEQPSEKRPLDLLRKATKGLEVSRRIFSFLGDRADTQHPGYDVKHAKERASYCKDVARVSEKKIHETDVLEKQKEERLKAIKESQQKIALDKIEKERLQKEEEERRKAEIERQRRELMERVQMDNVKIREQEQLEEVRKASKRAKEDESDGEKQSDGEERKPKKPKLPKKEKSQKRRRVMGSSDEEEEDSRKEKRIPGRQSNLSKEFVESDEEGDQS